MSAPASDRTVRRTGAVGRFVRRRWRWMAVTFVLILLVGGIVLAAGCVEIAAHIIATAPNHGKRIDLTRTLDKRALKARGVTQALRVHVGPPDASLSVWIVDPPQPPRGTILYLHGIFDNKQTLLPTAISHAQRGYRGILVDSRGHGESSGDWLTYGAREVRDYRQALDELEQRGLIAGRLGVYGCSYGGGVAVQLGGRDARVAAVVALSPFSSMRKIVHARTRSLGLSWLFSEKTVDAAIARACELAGVTAEQADGVAAMRSRPVPLLVIHGREDRTIPWQEGAEVCAAAQEAGSKLVTIEGATHEDWTKNGLRAIWTETTEWFDRWLGR